MRITRIDFELKKHNRNEPSKQKTFTQQNTVGYNDEELFALNRKWDKIVAREKLVPGTDEYNRRAIRLYESDGAEPGRDYI